MSCIMQDIRNVTAHISWHTILGVHKVQNGQQLLCDWNRYGLRICFGLVLRIYKYIYKWTRYVLNKFFYIWKQISPYNCIFWEMILILPNDLSYMEMYKKTFQRVKWSKWLWGCWSIQQKGRKFCLIYIVENKMRDLT